MRITITIEGHRYDITEFINKHPGEGIRQVWLREYNGKDASHEFDHMHMTDQPWEMLERARGENTWQGIKYLGPQPVKTSKIPEDSRDKTDKE